MNDAFGLIGGVFAGGGFTFDADEEIFVELPWENINDYNSSATEVQTTYSLVGVE